MLCRALIVCGVLAAGVYVATDIVSSLSYEGYSYVNQAVSELTALGAPTRAFAITLFTLHGLLQLAFGLGVLFAARGSRRLQVAGLLLVALGKLDLGAFLWPMHVRGAVPTLTDTLHIAATTMTVVLILGAIGAAAGAFERGFRIYSLWTIALVLVAGAAAGMFAPLLAAGLPTPWFGIVERLSIYAYMVWMGALALELMTNPKTQIPKPKSQSPNPKAQSPQPKERLHEVLDGVRDVLRHGAERPVRVGANHSDAR